VKFVKFNCNNNNTLHKYTFFGDGNGTLMICFSFLYVTVDYIERRCRSNRTDYGKLSDRIRKAKSGSDASSIALTPVQKWKLQRWAFVAPYIVKRRQHKASELGKVSICNNVQMLFTLAVHEVSALTARASSCQEDVKVTGQTMANCQTGSGRPRAFLSLHMPSYPFLCIARFCEICKI